MADEGTFAVADVADRSQGDSEEPLLPIGLAVSQRKGSFGEERLLCSPLDLQLVWACPEAGLFFYWPIAPVGYRAMGLVTSCSVEKPSLRRVVCVHESWALPARPVPEADGAPVALLPSVQGATEMAVWRLQGEVGELDANGEPLALELHSFAVLPRDVTLMPEAQFWTLRNPHFRQAALSKGDVLATFCPVAVTTSGMAIPSAKGMSLPPSSCMAQSMPSLLSGGGFLLERGPHEMGEVDLDLDAPIVSYCEFDVSEQRAKDIYFEWVEEHWCSTTTLRKQMSACSLTKVYLPHWVFSLCIRSSPAAAAELPCDEASAAAKSSLVSNLEDLLCCAVPDQDTASWASEVDTWRLSHTRRGRLREHVEPCGDWRVSWNQLIAELRADEELAGAKMEILSGAYSLVLLPVFKGAVFLEGGSRCYRFLVNGQTGQCTGERPLGLGVLGSSLVAIEQLFKKQRPLVGLQSGQALAKRDGSSMYVQQDWYLTFPPSQSSLLSSAVGWLRIANHGSAPVALSAYQRPACKRSSSAAYWLAPGETVTIPYRGNWCLRVDEGNATDVQVEQQCSTGGDSHEDVLLMV